MVVLLNYILNIKVKLLHIAGNRVFRVRNVIIVLNTWQAGKLI